MKNNEFFSFFEIFGGAPTYNHYVKAAWKYALLVDIEKPLNRAAAEKIRNTVLIIA